MRVIGTEVFTTSEFGIIVGSTKGRVFGFFCNNPIHGGVRDITFRGLERSDVSVMARCVTPVTPSWDRMLQYPALRMKAMIHLRSCGLSAAQERRLLRQTDRLLASYQ